MLKGTCNLRISSWYKTGVNIRVSTGGPKLIVQGGPKPMVQGGPKLIVQGGPVVTVDIPYIRPWYNKSIVITLLLHFVDKEKGPQSLCKLGISKQVMYDRSIHWTFLFLIKPLLLLVSRCIDMNLRIRRLWVLPGISSWYITQRGERYSTGGPKLI